MGVSFAILWGGFNQGCGAEALFSNSGSEYSKYPYIVKITNIKILKQESTEMEF